MTTNAALETHRRSNGQFGEHPRSDAGQLDLSGDEAREALRCAGEGIYDHFDEDALSRATWQEMAALYQDLPTSELRDFLTRALPSAAAGRRDELARELAWASAMATWSRTGQDAACQADEHDYANPGQPRMLLADISATRDWSEIAELNGAAWEDELDRIWAQARAARRPRSGIQRSASTSRPFRAELAGL